MLLGTNQIAGIFSDFKMDKINAEIMLLRNNEIAEITNDFKMDIIVQCTAHVLT